VERVLCTPHFSRLFPTRHEDAVERLHEFRSTLAEARIELELDLAAEVSPGMAVSAGDEELTDRAIGGRFLLLEVQPDTSEAFLVAATERLSSLDLLPVLAHPERGRALRRRLDYFQEAREAGALVQVVAPSLVGGAGRGSLDAAWDLVTSGLADLVASDAHGPWRSPADLAEAAHLLDSRVGEEQRRLLTEENPALLLSGVHPRDRPAARE
jgi:protein-tyrosine phosphatase